MAWFLDLIVEIAKHGAIIISFKKILNLELRNSLSEKINNQNTEKYLSLLCVLCG